MTNQEQWTMNPRFSRSIKSCFAPTWWFKPIDILLFCFHWISIQKLVCVFYSRGFESCVRLSHWINSEYIFFAASAKLWESWRRYFIRIGRWAQEAKGLTPLCARESFFCLRTVESPLSNFHAILSQLRGLNASSKERFLIHSLVERSSLKEQHNSKKNKSLVSFDILSTWRTGCFKFSCILKQYSFLGNGYCKNERFIVFYVQNISHFHPIRLIFQWSD